MIRHVIAIIAFAALLSSGSALAQHQGHGSHSGHGTPAAKSSATPAAKAFAEANETMHRDMAVPLIGNADADFVRNMIPHHQGAVAMAKIILAFGKKPDIRKLAEAIIAAQETEITQMKSWLTKNPAPPAQQDAAAIRTAFEAANARMHKDMALDYTQDADKDFLRGMIPHHEGAVAMAKILKQYGRDAELLALADRIIQSQNDEIMLMRKWLSAT